MSALTAEQVIGVLTRLHQGDRRLCRYPILHLDDATFVANRYHLTSDQIRAAAAAALAVSPKDTALFLFNKTVDLFCKSVTRGDIQLAKDRYADMLKWRKEQRL